MKIETSNKIMKLLQEISLQFPKFHSEASIDDAEIYLFFGDFGGYLRDGVEKGTMESIEMNDAFNFINRMGKHPEAEIRNLMTVGILEMLVDDEKVVRFSMEKLQGEALDCFKEIMECWK